MGPGTVNVVPHSHYPTRDGRWIAIACTNDKIFARLAEAMERPDLADALGHLGGAGAGPRRGGRNRRRVDSAIDRADLMKMCEASQVPCGPVYSIDEIFQDPQYAARENILRVDDPADGSAGGPQSGAET